MIQRLSRIGLWLAIIINLWFALYPRPPQLLPTDKDQHSLAFGVLTVLALVGYGRRYAVIAISLAAFGAAIEILQMIPVLHRDPEVMDWLTDCAAIAVAMAMVSTARRLWLTRAAP